ncbi:ParB N-terminal domain-containing protein [Aliivibrio sp. SR45-2]|uniref:ParB N-terminal domain-containing protein n=1 Tax=Aliivibrio sp. SR45-2 TaxID=2760931 RepID=UPI0015F9BF8F|nr:ParB N-terminal domain-containing protein [Aliivibrio sp. SR45-2]MBB1313409.1 ParB N-terminal domain-containing protein [Aliivibrio sp. SR45-2]
MKLVESRISELFDSFTSEFSRIEDKITIYNNINNHLYHFLGITHPVLNIQLLPSSKVNANNYNPNVVASPEYKLLKHSIMSDGLTLPIVVGASHINNEHVIIDGFHRSKIIKETTEINSSLYDYIPTVSLNKEYEERMTSTVRHNAARGIHQVELTSELVRKLKESNWEDEKIAKEIGMDMDEVLRLKQVTGLANIFSDAEFSTAWK